MSRIERSDSAVSPLSLSSTGRLRSSYRNISPHTMPSEELTLSGYLRANLNQRERIPREHKMVSN